MPKKTHTQKYTDKTIENFQQAHPTNNIDQYADNTNKHTSYEATPIIPKFMSNRIHSYDYFEETEQMLVNWLKQWVENVWTWTGFEQGI